RNGYNLYTDGLRAYTTLDSTVQTAAEAATQREAAQLQEAANREWGGEDFSVFWSRNPDLQTRFLRQSRRFRQFRDEGLPEDSALARVGSDAAYADSVRSFYQRV